MKKTTFSCVYAAQCTDLQGNALVKIGKANNPLHRVAGLQVGCPFEFHRVRYWRLDSEKMAIKAERKVQAALVRYWIRGEWFIFPVNDSHALESLEIAPAEVVSSILKRAAVTRSIDIFQRDKMRTFFEKLHGKHPPGVF